MRFPFPLRPSPKRHFADTRDGWRIALHRYKSRAPIGGQSPVVLCHGLGANRYNMDAPGRYSLARFLHAEGFDTWVVELRGAGQSKRKRVPGRRKKRTSWTFDDYVEHDVPAVLKKIREVTGAEDVHWVGHSMGGMLGYAYLGLTPQHHFRSLVTLASPTFSVMRSRILELVRPVRSVLRRIRFLPYRRVAQISSPLAALGRHFLPLIANPANMDPLLIQRLMLVTANDIPTALLDQFIEWYSTREFKDSYGVHSYGEGLAQITTPTYVIAGAADRLTPPEEMADVFDRLGAEDKRMSIFGRAYGHSVDYGHIDLVLGNAAPHEVFPEVADFIRDR